MPGPVSRILHGCFHLLKLPYETDYLSPFYGWENWVWKGQITFLKSNSQHTKRWGSKPGLWVPKPCPHPMGTCLNLLREKNSHICISAGASVQCLNPKKYLGWWDENLMVQPLSQSRPHLPLLKLTQNVVHSHSSPELRKEVSVLN